MICPYCNNYNEDDAQECQYCGELLPYIPGKKVNYVKWIAIAVGSIAAIICIVVGILLVGKENTKKRYEEKVVTAEKYLSAGNYQAAITAYNEALELNEDDEDLYEQLAMAYMEIDERDKADEILTLGYQKTKSERIKDLLKNLLSYGDLEAPTSDVASDAVTGSDEEVSLNQDFLDMCLNNGYQDYVSAYGGGSFTRESGDSVSFAYTDPNIKLFFVNASTVTFDSSTGTPIGDTKPSYIVMNSLDVLFNQFTGTVSYEKLSEIFKEKPEIKSGANGSYIRVNYYGCIFEIGSDENGNITSATAWNRITETGAGEDLMAETFDGTASGRIINASTGYGIADVKLTIREGSGNQYGDVILETKTDSQGNYSVDLDEGRYTVCAEAEGFLSEFFEINVVKGMTMAGQDLSMSSTLKSGQARIVLEWGADPCDLDAHLQTPSGEVSFMNQDIPGIASLDVDARSGYGPETVVIDDVSNGSYTYFVEHYSGAGSLATSGATVKIYMPGESQPQVVSVPGGSGRIWNVFTISGGKLSVTNSISN